MWSTFRMAIKHESGGVLSANKDILHYASDSGVWSRVLVRGGRPQGFLQEITIQLTPELGWDDRPSINEIKERKIKVFDPHASIYKTYTHLLPGNVYEKMTEVYSVTLRNFLLDTDILRFVNLEALLQFSHSYPSGVPFSMCSSFYPCKDSLIERLTPFPELYDMPYPLKLFMENLRTE